MSKAIICEIGCGDKKVFPNSIAIDIRKTQKVDVIADARFLPFKSESVDHVYSSHVIEHFSHRDVKLVLIEWVRILKPGSTFEIRCPDFRARALLFFINPSWNNVINVYGEQDYIENYHKCCFSYKLLRQILISLGINKLYRVYDGYHGIPFIPNDLHLIGKKSIYVKNNI
jgi:predicted SAM-dependent methyltransferase